MDAHSHAHIAVTAPDLSPNSRQVLSKNKALARRKDYARTLCRIMLRYLNETETEEFVEMLEETSARVQTCRYCPGLNAASYEVFRRFGMKGGAQ